MGASGTVEADRKPSTWVARNCYPSGVYWEERVSWNNCLLPRIRDTLGNEDIHKWSEKAITKWIVDHFGNYEEWEWVNRINCRFRLKGHKTTYSLRRIGKWFEVFNESAY